MTLNILPMRDFSLHLLLLLLVGSTAKSPFPSFLLVTLKYIMNVIKETETDFTSLVSETKINGNIKTALSM